MPVQSIAIATCIVHKLKCVNSFNGIAVLYLLLCLLLNVLNIFTVWHNGNMCLGNCIRGRDQLRQDILETTFTIDLPDNCDYVDCNNSITIGDGDLSFLELNIRGLYSKLPDLVQLIDSVSSDRSPDVLLLCETWLTKHTPTFNIPGYKICRTDRSAKRGGVVSILTSEKVRTKDKPDLSICKEDFECCGVEIITNTHPILALSVYRPPNTNPTSFITNLSKLVHTIKKSKNTGIIIGLDHNLDFLKSVHMALHINSWKKSWN